MTVARIEIDFTIEPGELLEAFLEYIGDMVIAVLDPHEEGEECTRWVSIEAYEMEEEEYEIDTAALEEIEHFLAIPDNQRDNSEYN